MCRKENPREVGLMGRRVKAPAASVWEGPRLRTAGVPGWIRWLMCQKAPLGWRVTTSIVWSPTWTVVWSSPQGGVDATSRGYSSASCPCWAGEVPDSISHQGPSPLSTAEPRLSPLVLLSWPVRTQNGVLASAPESAHPSLVQKASPTHSGPPIQL